jgi:hypothetical protein
MAVKEPPLVWRTFAEEHVELSEGGTVATQLKNHITYEGSEDEDIFCVFSHVTTGVERTEGRHYWEVELLSKRFGGIYVGISRPNLAPVGDYLFRDCTDGWFIDASYGALYGNGKEGNNFANSYDQGDRVGVLLDLNNGSLLFFKNGEQNGPGYTAGSLTGPLVAAVELRVQCDKVRLHADVAFPAGHAQ